MKNCQNCGMELADDAMFCSNCGTKQEAPLAASPAEAGQAQAIPPAAPPPPPYQAGPAPPPPQAPYPYPYPSQPPKPPSALALDAKRYPKWLIQGFFGTREPMHILFAAIVPFFVSLFSTLEAARIMNWHAGGFFLLWFFMLIILGAMPTMAWVYKKFILKEEERLIHTFARFSSCLNVVLPVSLIAFILGVVLPGGTFISVLMYVVPILIFAAAVMSAVAGSQADLKKLWLITLVIAGVFFVLLFLYSAIFSQGLQWSFRKAFRF